MERAVLIVEPDRLLRWSLATYLNRWFTVYPLASRAEAKSFLDRHTVDAVIISDEIDEEAATAEIERKALARNPTAKVIRIVMSANAAGARGSGAVLAIEKPFELPAIARMLDVTADSI